MALAGINLQELRASAARAAATQMGAFENLRFDSSQLVVRELPTGRPPIESIGVVAADAGLVTVELTPFSLEFLFVADSRHRTHLAEIIPLTTLAENLREIFARAPCLENFADRLRLTYDDMEGLWSKQAILHPLFPPDVRLVADTLRELAEWAVCCELAEEDLPDSPSHRPSRLILHDGLLSSPLFRHDVISHRLPEWWRRQWVEHGVALAGVGKTSVLWQRLALALDMDARVQSTDECYVVISEELEAAMQGRKVLVPRMGFGRLVLLKIRLHPTGFYLPVDLPPWILDDPMAADEVLAAVAHASQTTFPRPGYPAPLGEAHEAAHLTSFDAKVIRDLVVTALRDLLPPEEFEPLLRGWAFQPAQWSK